MNLTFIRGWTKRNLKSGRMNGRLLPVISLLLFFVDFWIHPNVSSHVEICGGMLAATIIGGIASGAVSALTSAGGQALNNALFGSPMSQQKELMDYQYDKQKEFMDYQNEYNTPANQLDRFEEAGVNPNLAMNFGLGSAGNSQYSVPNPNQFRTSQDFQNLMEDSFYKQNQAQLAEALAKSEDTFRDSKLEQLMIQNKHEQIVSSISELEKKYKEEFGRTKYASEINKDIQGALALHYQAYKYAMEGDVESVNALFAVQDKLFDLGMKHLNYQFESSTLFDRIKQVQQMLINLGEQQKEIKARANAANASATESRAHANLYDKQAYGQDLANSIQEVYKDATTTNRQAVIDQLGSFLSANDKKNLLDDQEYQRRIEVLNKAEDGSEYFKALDRLWIYLKERVPDVHLPILITPFK